MKFFTWLDQYDWVVDLILYGGILYYYIKNRNKKVDEEKEHWYSTAGMTIFILAWMSVCVLGIVFYDDPSKLDQIKWPVLLTAYFLLAIVFLHISYRFRNKKKSTDNQFETTEEAR